MKKEYYIQAANSIKGKAIAMQKRQTNIEKETQTLFFWILKFFERDIKYASYWNDKKNKFCLEIKNYKLRKKDFNGDKLMCYAERYSSLFVSDEEFEKVIQKVVKVFNSIKGYKAEYFAFAKYGDTMLRITLDVENMEEE